MKKIKEIVTGLVARFQCSSPEALCEKMGITVITQELPEHINGFTVRMEGLPFIVINSCLDYGARRVTVAHELGHIVLHGSTNTVNLSCQTSFCVNRIEKEADCFAALLLMEEELSELEGRESITAEDISKLTHVPRNKIEDVFFG